jgi:hypothetical protein
VPPAAPLRTTVCFDRRLTSTVQNNDRSRPRARAPQAPGQREEPVERPSQFSKDDAFETYVLLVIVIGGPSRASRQGEADAGGSPGALLVSLPVLLLVRYDRCGSRLAVTPFRRANAARCRTASARSHHVPIGPVTSGVAAGVA